MKKNYLTMGLLLTCGVAYAALPKTELTAQSVVTNLFEQKLVLDSSMKKAKAQAPSKETVLGNYVHVYLDMNSDSNYLLQGDVILRESADGGYEFLGLDFVSGTPIPATIDFSNKKITCPAETYLFDGKDADGNTVKAYFCTVEINSENRVINTGKPIEFTITDGGLELPQGTILAVSALNGGGFWSIINNNMFSMRPSKLSNDGWKDYGTAEFTDGWYVNEPTINGSVSKDPYKVAVQESTDQPGLLRLVNPYGVGTPYEKFNNSMAEGSVVFYIGEPEYVVPVAQFYPQVIGQWGDGSDAICYFGEYSGLYTDQGYYNGNQTGYFYYDQDFGLDEIADEIGREESSYFADENTIILNDIDFGVSGQTNKIYGGWTSADQMLPAKIVLKKGDSGVESVDMDGNAPKTFFNLQGVEIANPEKGSIVIVRQGGKSVKTVVR